MEIYNERVRDLLPSAAQSKTERYTLKVRAHPKDGPFVEGTYVRTYRNASHSINSLVMAYSLLVLCFLLYCWFTGNRFVSGLRKHVVKDNMAVQTLISRGNENR